MRPFVLFLCLFSAMLSGCASPPPSQQAAKPANEQTRALTPDSAATIAKLEQYFGLPSAPETPDAQNSATPPEAAPVADLPQDSAAQGVMFQALDAPPVKISEDAGVGLNFDNADIYDVTKVVSEITKKSFILDKGIEGKTVTIFSETPLTPDQVFELYKHVLELNDLAIVQVGDFYKIGEKKKVQPPALGEASGVRHAENERFVTQIIKLKYVRADTVKEALKDFVPASGKEIVVYPDDTGDTLIVTDVAENVRKILAVIQQIDVSEYADQYSKYFHVRHAPLTQVIHDLNNILSLQQGVPETAAAPSAATQAQPTTEGETREGTAAAPRGSAATSQSQLVPPGTRTRIHPIERLNAFVVSTNQPEVIRLVEQWLSVLDVPSSALAEAEDPDVRKNHIYPVQYAKADELAELLMQIYDRTYQPQPTTPEPVAQGENQDNPQQAETTTRRTQPRGSADAPDFVADKNNNTIVINATPTEYAEILNLLEKLDRRPLQVMIDVIVAEVQLQDTDVFGVQGMLLGEGQLTVGPETNAVESISQTVFSNVLPADAEGFRFIASAPGRFLMQLRALATENRLKVLSDPHILVRNNEEASIKVGDDIPISKTTGTGDNTQKSVEYRTTGIVLTVKPSINDQGDVVMNVAQEVSDVGQESFGNTGAASFSKREVKTSVVTPDNQPIIMGGLMTNRGSESHQGMPLMKDVPLLGRMFRHNDQQYRRVELIILVTPRVVRNQEEGWNLTENVLTERIKRLEEFFNREETDSDKVKRYLKKPFTGAKE